MDKLAPLDTRAWRKPSSSPSPGLVLLVVTAVWGSTFSVTKDLVAILPPLGYLELRFGIAALVLVPVAMLRLKRLTPHFMRDVLVVGMFNASGLVFQVLGQIYTTASKSAFITSLNTPFTVIVGLAFYRIVPTAAQKLAITIATVGLLLLTWPSDGARVNPGDLLTVACALLYGFFITESARRAPRHDSVLFAFGQICIATLLVVVSRAVAVRLHWPLEARVFVWTPRLVVQMTYMSMFCVVGTMLTQTWALQRLSAATAAVIYATEPVFAMAIAVAVDGASEWPGPRGATGAMLVLLGVYVAEGRNLRRERTQASANITSSDASDGTDDV